MIESVLILILNLPYIGVNSGEPATNGKVETSPTNGIQKPPASKTNAVPRAVTKAKQMYMGETTPARRKARLKEVKCFRSKLWKIVKTPGKRPSANSI